MDDSPYRRHLRTLEALGPGSRAEIRYIAFRGIRDACREVGLREGDVVVCRAASEDRYLLDTERNGTVSLDGSWARFIEVDMRSRESPERLPAEEPPLAPA